MTSFAGAERRCANMAQSAFAAASDTATARADRLDLVAWLADAVIAERSRIVHSDDVIDWRALTAVGL